MDKAFSQLRDAAGHNLNVSEFLQLTGIVMLFAAFCLFEPHGIMD
jgi:hypothetical protein